MKKTKIHKRKKLAEKFQALIRKKEKKEQRERKEKEREKTRE